MVLSWVAFTVLPWAVFMDSGMGCFHGITIGLFSWYCHGGIFMVLSWVAFTWAVFMDSAMSCFHGITMGFFHGITFMVIPWVVIM